MNNIHNIDDHTNYLKKNPKNCIVVVIFSKSSSIDWYIVEKQLVKTLGNIIGGLPGDRKKGGGGFFWGPVFRINQFHVIFVGGKRWTWQ